MASSLRRELGQQRRIANSNNPHVLVTLARKHTSSAMATIIKLMEDPLNPPAVRLRAAEIVIERGYGKAAQSILIEDKSTLGVGAQAMTIAERIVALKMAQERGGQTVELENSSVRQLPAPIEAELVEDLVG